MHHPLFSPHHVPSLTSRHEHRFFFHLFLNREEQHSFVSHLGLAVGAGVGAGVVGEGPGPKFWHVPFFLPTHRPSFMLWHLHRFFFQPALNLDLQHSFVSQFGLTAVNPPPTPPSPFLPPSRATSSSSSTPSLP